MGLGKDLPLWLQLFLQFINFAVLVAALVYFLRKPLKEYLLKRHDTVKEKIEEADRLLREAEEAKKKYEERLSKLDGEIEAFRASLLAEMEKEKTEDPGRCPRTGFPYKRAGAPRLRAGDERSACKGPGRGRRTDDHGSRAEGAGNVPEGGP